MPRNENQLKASLRAKESELTRARLALRAAMKKRADLEALIDDVKAELPDDIEQQIAGINDTVSTCKDQVETLTEEIANLNETLSGLGGPEPDSADPKEDPKEDPAKRSRARTTAPESRSFRCRSGLFATRTQRDAFYARQSVADWLQRVRALAQSKRSVTGAELTIPTDVLDVLRDNLHRYSKLIRYVMLKPVSGKARQPSSGEVPEGIWMEMSGVLNNLELRFTQVETDGYKVGGFVPIDNYLLQDSDIALGK